MQLSWTFEADRHLLYATLVGHFSLSDAKTTFMEILDVLVQHQPRKVLIDACALTGEPTTMERYQYGKFVAEAVRGIRQRGVPSMPRFAYVMVEPVLDPRRLGETVAANRGMFVKVFDNLDEALQWL